MLTIFLSVNEETMVNQNELQQLQTSVALVSSVIQQSPMLAANIAHSIAAFVERNPEIAKPLLSATSRTWILSFAASVGEKPLANFLEKCGVDPAWNNISVFLFKLASAFAGWSLDGTFERRMLNVAITNGIFIVAFAYWSKTHPNQVENRYLSTNERNQLVHYKSSAVTIVGSSVMRQLIAAHFFSKNPFTVEQSVNLLLGALGSLLGSVAGFGLGKFTMWTLEKASNGFSGAILKMNGCASSCYRMFPSAVRRYMPVPNSSRYSSSYEMNNFRV